MTQGMQGSWTISVKQKSAAWPQRFKIQGSTNGVDGDYPAATTTPPVFATGTQWGITVEHDPPSASWTKSRYRLANFRVSGGQFSFDIETDDTHGDLDFNDLILTCSIPLAQSEYVIYGNVKTYSGFCLVNPCYPRRYYVIDDVLQLERLVKYKPILELIEKFYPERVKKLVKRPFPEPDPRPFTPMMIPSGLRGTPGIVVQGYPKEPVELPKTPRRSMRKKADNPGHGNPVSYKLVAEKAYYSTNVALSELSALTQVVGSYRLRCVTKTLTQTLVQFIEYDRTDSEKLGGSYTGDGNREVLGTSVTDEQGNYIFRFSQSIPQIVEEGTDVAADEDLETHLRPDMLIQILESLPGDILYESAPYYNIANIRCINLCLPESSIGKPITSCQGGRAIQAIGDIPIVPHSGTELHSDGTITHDGSLGPDVQHAAWRGILDLYACFVDTEPHVDYYTLQYKLDTETDWHWVTESYYYPKLQSDGTSQSEKVGPYKRDLQVSGPGIESNVDCYMNIEDNWNWLVYKRYRKIRLNSTLYHSSAGAVEFKIEGYTSTGEKVPGAVDTVKLHLDNVYSAGDIEYVKFGTMDPGECALIEIPNLNSPLAIKYTLTDEHGFLKKYSVKAYRGSNTHVLTENVLTNLAEEYEYQNVTPYRFYGTTERTLEPNGYIEISLVPLGGGNWLPTGKTFCAFSFELTSMNRLTDGQYAYGTRLLWRELVGISYTPAGAP